MSENKYPEYLMAKLRQRLGLERDDTSQDDYISRYAPSEAFHEVLGWDGLLGGWDYEIKKYVRDIYKIDLDELDGK